jgi:ABC-type transport system substrate-binding protein
MRRLAFLHALCALLVSLPASPADPAKVLRIAFQNAESTFDPALFQDTYSAMVADNILDAMLRYDYLARPAKVIPNTVEALPEISADGLTYTFRVRPGIYFTPDAAFKGKRRELVAADYAYSILRFYDPKVKSPNLYLVEGKIAGLDEAAARARKTGTFDYDARYPGLQVLDRYTLRVRLTRPDSSFLYNMAIPQFGAVAREVAEFHSGDVGSHPVGTGPYRLLHWRRGHRIVLEANPEYRETYLAEPQAPPVDIGDSLPRAYSDAEIVRDIGGRKLPIIGRVEISIIEENQPRWLAFANGEHDLLQWVPAEFINTVAPDGKLAPYLAKRGVRLQREVAPRTGYTYFNLNDPMIGGYGPENVALRRAITLGYNVSEEIRVLRKNQAIAAQTPIPPGVSGYDPALRSPSSEYSPARAKALLDMFGFVDRDGDGYRERPDGSPLFIEMASRTDSEARTFDELWRRGMDEIGVRMVFRKSRFADLLKESLANRLQMWMLSWSANVPDGDMFMQMFYGPNSGSSNDAHFRLAAYDRLYEEARVLQDSPQRRALYLSMNKLILAYAPWVMHVHHVNTHLASPWLKGFRQHPFFSAPWRYLDIDLEARARAAGSPD